MIAGTDDWRIEHQMETAREVAAFLEELRVLHLGEDSLRGNRPAGELLYRRDACQAVPDLKQPLVI